MLLLGEEEWNFLQEVLFRSAIMFIAAIVALRLIGRRGIMQGVFELVTIITLGSAAGDPMFYRKVGLLPALLVFIAIVLMYKLTNFFLGRSKQFEHLIEGRHVRLIKDGRFILQNMRPEDLNKDEIFSDLRMEGVSHLGQVENAYLEASGQISVFFYPDEQVKYGLPTFPEKLEHDVQFITEAGFWSCGFCGNTEQLHAQQINTCQNCGKNKWIRSVNNVRVQ